MPGQHKESSKKSSRLGLKKKNHKSARMPDESKYYSGSGNIFMSNSQIKEENNENYSDDDSVREGRTGRLKTKNTNHLSGSSSNASSVFKSSDGGSSYFGGGKK